jgi:hypothetical protein
MILAGNHYIAQLVSVVIPRFGLTESTPGIELLSLQLCVSVHRCALASTRELCRQHYDPGQLAAPLRNQSIN